MKHVVTTVGGVVALIKHGLGTLVVTSVTMVDKVDISMVYDQNLMGLNMTFLVERDKCDLLITMTMV